MIKNLLCPVSPLRVNENVVRIVAALVILLVALYIYTGSPYFIFLLIIDFYIRAFTALPFSPLGWTAKRISAFGRLREIIIDKAPKIFAARVGFLFTLAILLLFYIHPPSSIVVAFVLIGFAALEALFNICVGCLVYSYIVFPLFEPQG